MLRAGPVLAITALLLALPMLPDLLVRLQRSAASSGPFPLVLGSPEPPQSAPVDPSLRPLALLQGGLLAQLRQADNAWVPRAEPLPGGGTRYLYKRRPGDPELTIPQIRALMASPPNREQERRSITSLLRTLDRAGTAVGLMDPLKPGAAAEWDPQARTLRIAPTVPQQGTVEFARVLNHEAIHVAQSCAAGGLGASPKPLGLPLAAGGKTLQLPADHPLQDPVYANLSPLEERMEKEAYALQDRLGVGERLVRALCLDGRAA